MDKPFSMIYEEFKQKMASIINNSGLPPSVIESVLKNYLSEVNNIAKNQYQIDKEKYEKSLTKDSCEEEVADIN